MRQHPAFPELLKAVEAPQLPRFKTLETQGLDTYGAKFVYYSGKLDQHEAWLTMLTGPKRETD